ncbi:MAG: endo-1,4-beta-xylanase [Melioribacter sp.]|nr:endo-1,4-beta-xylanase [Melioribacter sp.]
MKNKLLIYTTCLLCTIFFGNINYKIFAQPLAFGKEKFLGNVFGGSGVPMKFDDYWNQITPENATKWASVEPVRDQYNWTRADEIYNYAKQRGYPFKFHTLIWGQQYPNWITSLSQEEQLEEIEEWFRLVGERYPDMEMIDVVNEPLPNHAPPPFRNALGGSGTTGWDWVIKSFELARKYMPKAKLILNDYSIINDNYNTTQFLNIINLLKERNLIDAIGVQGHRFELENASNTTLKNNLDRLAATGLPIYISEFDLGNLGDSGTPDDNKQLELYQRIFPLLWEHPAIKGITLWGYIEGQIWQRTCYLLRLDGRERPALRWLRQYLTSKNTYRTLSSGNWNDYLNWQVYDGSSWITATKSPDLNDDLVVIRNGHTITLTAKDSIDQFSVLYGGKLIIAKGVELKIKDGVSTDLTVNGTIENYGTLKKEQSATISFQEGSIYYHKQDGGEIPIAFWSSGSTIQFDSIKTIIPKNTNQNFYHFIWNCTNQSVPINLGWDGNTIGGNVSVLSTGNNKLYLCKEGNNNLEITILGDLNLSGGELSAQSSALSSNVKINLNGNLNITGGKFLLNPESSSNIPLQQNYKTIWKLNKGNLTIRNATVGDYSLGKIEFANKGGVQSINLQNVEYLRGGLTIEVDSNVTLDLGLNELKGEGKFFLNKGALLQTAHQSGIDGSIKVSGQKILSSDAGFIFNGTSAQVTGISIPDSVSSITIANNSSLTLSKNIFVKNLLEIKSGLLQLAGNKLTYGTESTLKYSGTTSQTTRDEEFPSIGGPKNLIVANSTAGVDLHASRKLEGKLELQGKLRLGNNNLEVAEAISSSTSRYVIADGDGALKISVGNSEVLFPVGTTTAYAPVWIENKGTKDLISVQVKDDKGPAPAGGRVLTKWIINEAVPGGGNYTLKFGWVITLEDATFRQDRNSNAYIFNLADTTEAGSGAYEKALSRQPYTIKRGGIEKLGTFAVGKFSTIVSVKEKEIIQNEFYLSQNYPNPFNPSTKIKYILGKPTNVKLVIYNILGQEIKTLINSYQQSGEYEVTWEAKDNFDRDVESGVYFYRLITDNQILQNKMILIR